MQAFDLVIKNGTVATAADVIRCDIGIRDGRVVALGEDLDADRVIDATGKIVMPGGIDSHLHLDQPTGDGSVMADDFLSGTISAACGGTTTIIPFACQQKGHSIQHAIDDYHARAGNKPVIDYSFHLIVTDTTKQVLEQELPALIKQGYTSFKIYMTYDALKLNDHQILDILSIARQEGAMAMIHAENSDCIAWLTEKLEQAGKTAPHYHAASRPPVVEREATHRAISLAELVDVPVLIVHVSGPEAIDQIRWAQNRGYRVYAETCPQYLFLTAEDLEREGFEGAKCVCSPPPRDKSSQQDVWRGIENGTFQVFSSDHAPFRFEDDKGKKMNGEKTAFKYIPNGVPGVETRLPLLFSEGVGKGRIDLRRFVELASTNAARIYGLYPRKGTIAVGSDADIAIWDPDKEVTISNSLLHHNVDYTPYEGMQVRGWPQTVISRGEIVAQDGEFCGQKSHGQFLKCERPEPAKPKRSGART